MCTSALTYVFGVSITFLVVVGTGVLHGFAWVGTGVELDIFQLDRNASWEEHDLPVAQTGWMFYMWTLCYLYQTFWVVYGMSLACRQTDAGYLYISPALVPCSIYIFFMLGCGFILGWLFLWLRLDYFRFSILSLLGTLVCFYIALAIALHADQQAKPTLQDVKAQHELFPVRILVQNGIATIATWATIVLLYQVDALLIMFTSLDKNTASYVVYGIMLMYLSTWVVCDLCFQRSEMKYLLVPYVVFIISFTGIVVKHAGKSITSFRTNLHLILSGILLTLSILFLLVKFTALVGARRKIIKNRQHAEADKDSLADIVDGSRNHP